MKKIIPICLVLTFIIPHIVFASWWNPFSWSIFNRKDQKTMILENKVKELELKLNNTNTERISTSSPIKQPEIKKIDTVKSTIKTTVGKEDNFNTVLSAEYNSRYELYNKYIDQIINPIIDYVDRDLNRMIKTKNETSAQPQSDLGNTILKAYGMDIEWTKNTKTFLLGYKAKFNEKANSLKKESNDVLGKNISREEAISTIKSLRDVQIDIKLKSDFSNAFEEYKKGREENDILYQKAFARAKSELEQQSLLNKYQPAPSINRVKITNCSIVGNSLNCLSY